MCMIDGCDDRVTVLHERHPKARRAHKCGECNRQIAPGESYMVERYVDPEKNASTHKTCSHCQVVRSWLLAECGGFVYGFIQDDIVEHAGEYGYGFAVKKLAVGVSRKWLRKDGRMWPIPRAPKTTHEQMSN